MRALAIILLVTLAACGMRETVGTPATVGTPYAASLPSASPTPANVVMLPAVGSGDVSPTPPTIGAADPVPTQQPASQLSPVPTSPPAPSATSVPPTPTSQQAAPLPTSSPVLTPNIIVLPAIGGGPLPTAVAATVVPDGTITVTVRERQLQALVVSTYSTRATGLMYVTALPEDSAMLFVYASDQQLSFWMRNTAIPLSIAFIDSNGLILNMRDMQPFDEQTYHASTGLARYALEVNQGWFARNGVQVGDVIQLVLPTGLVIE